MKPHGRADPPPEPVDPPAVIRYEVGPLGRSSDLFTRFASDGSAGSAYAGADVGSFNQGNELSRWMLRRYLLTRTLGSSIVRTVHWFGVAWLVVAALVWWAGVHWLAALIGFVGIVVLLVRVLLSAIQHRIGGLDRRSQTGIAVQRLVGRTRKELRAELRRIGLPGAPWGPVLIGLRLARPRRRTETLQRLAAFDLAHVVPASTLDELHLVLRRESLPR
jgi:hypothetical protein